LKNVLAVFTGASTLERRRVAQLAKKLNIREKVVCLPQLLEPDMKYMYSIASVVVSIAYRESFGLTALEALVMGVPVIISQTSGVSEILQHRVHALHVSPDDYAQLASHIEELLTNSQLAEKIARNGRLKVLNGFTIQNFVSSLIKEIISFQR
jgi:glycosyltransferase involved in cell wall biosynthesis